MGLVRLKEDKAVLIYCFLISFSLLLICTKSSFLYPINDWADPNCYFTMGKSMFRGKVLYRDILDHKGPYIFLIYGVASLISSSDFIGVFILEVLSWSIFLYFNYRICILYVKQTYGLIVLPVLSAVILSSYSFYYGGSAEEFCLPFLSIGLYNFLEYFRFSYPNKSISYKKILISGICAGILFLIKFNLIGFYIAWIFVFFIINILSYNIRRTVKEIAVFLIGWGLTTIPWIAYFGFNNALNSFWHEYFYKNIFLYGNEESSVLKILVEYVVRMKYNFRVNFAYFILILLGFSFIILNKNFFKIEKIGYFLLCLMSYALIYIGRIWNYYSIPLAVFAVLGFIPICKFIEYKKRVSIPIFPVCLTSYIISFIFAFTMSVNIEFLSIRKQDLFQYDICSLIEKDNNTDLLLYGVYDFGIYTLCDIEPASKYFFQNNMEELEREIEWNQIITDGNAKYILSNDTFPSDIYKNYKLIYNEQVILEKREINLFLFERKI